MNEKQKRYVKSTLGMIVFFLLIIIILIINAAVVLLVVSSPLRIYVFAIMILIEYGFFDWSIGYKTLGDKE